MKTLPMSTKEVMGFFQKPDEVMEIDLENSSLQGNVFVTYITNMRMKTTVVKGTAQQRYDLLIPYLTSEYSTSCDSLREGAIDLLMWFIGLPSLYNTWISEADLALLAGDNLEEELGKITEFLDSLVTCIPSFNTKYKEEVFNKLIESGEIEVVTDATAIGPNVLGLLEPANFFEIFCSTGKKEVKKYFKPQFEIMKFNNKGLFDILSNRKGLLMPIMNLLYEPTKENIAILKKHKKAIESCL